MKIWLRQQHLAGLQAVRLLLGSPLGTLLNALVLGMVAALPGAGFTLLDDLAQRLPGFSERAEISIFMDAAASRNDSRMVERELRAIKGVANLRFVPREEALQRLKESGLGDVLAEVSGNPLPDAFIVTPNSNSPQLFAQLENEFRGLPKVAQVQLDSAWVKRLHALVELANTALVVIATLLASALVIVTVNTIRLQIYSRKIEIEVASLLGATPGFIRRPFYYLGSLQGLLGGVIGLEIINLTFDWLRGPIAIFASSYGLSFGLEGLSWSHAALLLFTTTLLGWAGAGVSLRRHLGV